MHQPYRYSLVPGLEEIVNLRRIGFRFIALADDNFYPVTLTDLELAKRQNNAARLAELKGIRAERFELMARLAQLPPDTVFFTQITMEAAEDAEFLAAMKAAHIHGALVGVEAVTPEGLKDVYKDFNLAGQNLVDRLRKFRRHDIHVLGSFIFGLPSDRPHTFAATAAVAEQAELTAAAQRDYETAPTPSRQLRFALVLANPGHPATDLPRAQRLLRELMANPEMLLSGERALAFLELQQIDDHLTLEAENRRLQGDAVRADRERLGTVNRRLQLETDENARLRKELEEARAKLDAIANIERSLNERKPSNEGRQP